MKKYIAYNIKWDTDNDKDLFDQLPKEIEIPDEVWEDYDNGNDDALSDYVSDVTGFCHYGFEIKTENIKEEKIMNNITIYDRIELGDTFHNSNGTDYIILAFNKEADIALLLNPKNKFTPYVGADGLRSNHWCFGHYFKTLQEACDWFNKEIDTIHDDEREEEEEFEDKFCVGTSFDNGSGEYYSTKKETMEEAERIIDELLVKYPECGITISIDIE